MPIYQAIYISNKDVNNENIESGKEGQNGPKLSPRWQNRPWLSDTAMIWRGFGESERNFGCRATVQGCTAVPCHIRSQTRRSLRGKLRVAAQAFNIRGAFSDS
jgi:hypothetical protein